jgi:hypothetical protein
LVKREVNSYLEHSSLLVIVNISYQNTKKYKAAASNSNNDVMKNWLCVGNIPFCDTVSKV